MSEFEKELDRILCNGVTVSDEKFYLYSNLVGFFKDWQPPKKLVEVPQCVADWFEENKHDLEYKVWEYINHWDEEEENEFKMFMDFNVNKPIQTIFKMLEGYTVEKEQLYYLKNKLTNKYLLEHKVDLYFDEDELNEESSYWKTKFNQSEIDELNIGSYEQIPVKVDEVEG